MPDIADVKNYWDKNPCFIKRSSAPVGSPQFLIETEQRKRKSEPHIWDFAGFDKWYGKRILEIGCGQGIDAVQFARGGAKITAVDISENSIELARKRAELAGIKIDFKQMNAENLVTLPFSYYDLVYAFGSIHHSPNPYLILATSFFRLKHKGTLKLMVYHKYSWKALWIMLKYGHGKFWKFSELIAKHSEAQIGCPITHTYSRRSIRKLIESAGFRVKKISVDHIFPYEIEAYKHHEYKKIWYFRWMPSWLFRAFERLAGWHLLVEAEA